MDDSSITMEDYILSLTEEVCWNNQIFDNWKLAVKGKTRRKLNAGNIECLRLFEIKFPAIKYDDSLCYKESPLQNSSQIFDDTSELSLPNTDYCMYMSEKKIFKKRFAKKMKFEVLKIDTNLFSYYLTLKTLKSTTNVVILVKIPQTFLYAIHHLLIIISILISLKHYLFLTME